MAAASRAVRLEISGRNSDFFHVFVDLQPSYTDGMILAVFSSWVKQRGGLAHLSV